MEKTIRASLVAQRLKRLPGMQEIRVRSLGREDPLEKEMATHSSTLAWRIPWKVEPGRLQSMGVTKSQTRLSDFTFTFTDRIVAPQRWRCPNPPCECVSLYDEKCFCISD